MLKIISVVARVLVVIAEGATASRSLIKWWWTTKVPTQTSFTTNTTKARYTHSFLNPRNISLLTLFVKNDPLSSNAANFITKRYINHKINIPHVRPLSRAGQRERFSNATFTKLHATSRFYSLCVLVRVLRNLAALVNPTATNQATLSTLATKWTRNIQMPLPTREAQVMYVYC